VTEPRSIVGQLTRGLTMVGVIGGIALAAVLVIDLDRWLEEQLLLSRGGSGLTGLKLFVLLCFTFTICSLILAARRVVRRALAPLHDSVGQIEQAIAAPRGFRLDLAGLPVEVAGYGTAINGLIDHLERVAIRREAFAAEVAHELKNPMAILLLELDSIAGAETGRLKADVRRMSRLIDQLLVLARLEAHAAAPVRSTVINLAELASELAQSMVPGALDEGRHIALTLEDHDPVHGRRELVWAAMRNMVENALRVTPPRGVVTLTVGPGARFGVADGGPGLSKPELARMTKPFAQARHPSATGAGLGLAIIDQVARLHGGSLDCDPDRKEIILNLSAVPYRHEPPNQYVNLG
jgi:two-component system OmpR family sensor kinase